MPQWKVWRHPFRQDDLETFDEDKIPPGVKTVVGIQGARRTIQQYEGKVPPGKAQEADIGAFRATVTKAPTPEPGAGGEIEFKRDVPSSKVRGGKSEGLGKLALATSLEQLITIALRSSESEVGKLSAGTFEALGMTVEEAQKAKPSARVVFAKRRLAEKLEDTAHNELVRTISKMGLTSAEQKQLLGMMPDREAAQVRLMLSSPGIYAPVRRRPPVLLQPSYLRRKKIRTKVKRSRDYIPGIGTVRP